jgi:hypothetical protein
LTDENKSNRSEFVISTEAWFAWHGFKGRWDLKGTITIRLFVFNSEFWQSDMILGHRLFVLRNLTNDRRGSFEPEAINPLAEKVAKVRRERFACLRLAPRQKNHWGDETKVKTMCPLFRWIGIVRMVDCFNGIKPGSDETRSRHDGRNWKSIKRNTGNNWNKAGKNKSRNSCGSIV